MEKIIYEGEKIPFGYGISIIRFDCMGYEVLPIPLNYIKRFWYWTIQKTKLFNWEKELLKRKEKLFDVGFQAGKETQRREDIVKLKTELDRGVQIGWDLFSRAFKFRNLPNDEYYQKIQEIRKEIEDKLLPPHPKTKGES